METLRVDAFDIKYEVTGPPFGVLALCFAARYASVRAVRGMRIIRLAITPPQWVAIEAVLDEGFGGGKKKFLGKDNAIVEVVRRLVSRTMCEFRDTVQIQPEGPEHVAEQLDAFLNRHVEELAGEWQGTGRGERDRS